MKSVSYLGLALCLLLVLPAQAEVYKWTDEYGQVHYGDKPPSEDTPEFKLRSPATQDGNAQYEAPTDAQRRANQKKLSDSLEADRRDKEQAVTKRKEKQAKRAHNCKLAQKDLNILLKMPRIYDYDQQGNKIYYSDAQRQQLIAERRAAVRKWCE